MGTLRSQSGILIALLFWFAGCFPGFTASSGGCNHKTVEDQSNQAKVLATIPFRDEGLGINKRCKTLAVELSIWGTKKNATIKENLTYPENASGTLNFTAANSPNYEAMTELLTNNHDDYIIANLSFGNTMGCVEQWLSYKLTLESFYFPGDTDLVGHNITLIRLVINEFTITPGAVWDLYDIATLDISWEMWGYSLPPKTRSTTGFLAIIGLIGVAFLTIKARWRNHSKLDQN